MEQTIVLTLQGAIAVLCWLIVAGGAGLAVFARSVHDTVPERVGLSAVSITATGAACRVIVLGWETTGGAALAASVAFYVAVVAYKHIRGDCR